MSTRLKDVLSTFLLWSVGVLSWVNPYTGAWLLMDRPERANDNGEALFRHLRAMHPGTRAFFVLRPDSPDWTRLAQDGLGRHLVEHGSLRWRLINASSVVQASSMPIARRRGVPSHCILVYLKHGVTTTDHSRWLNQFTHDLVLSATPTEHAFLTSPTSPYLHSQRLRLTGLPRFDRLYHLTQGGVGSTRNVVVVAPTWRQWEDKSSDTNPRSGGSRASGSLEHWLRFLSGSGVRSLIDAGLNVVLVPHPRTSAAVREARLPPGVEVCDYSTDDVQSIFARSALCITDYSSVQFDAAFSGASVIYYQFDRDRFHGGGHKVRKGYWDADTMGFGPVVLDSDSLDRELHAWLRRGRRAEDVHVQRAQAAFPKRDGRSCERVVAEISRVLSIAERGRG